LVLRCVHTPSCSSQFIKAIFLAVLNSLGKLLRASRKAIQPAVVAILNPGVVGNSTLLLMFLFA